MPQTNINAEFDIEVNYHVNAPTRGHCDKYGAPEEPDDPGGVEIDTIFLVLDDGKRIDITESMCDGAIEEITQTIEDELSNQCDEGDDDADQCDPADDCGDK